MRRFGEGHDLGLSAVFEDQPRLDVGDLGARREVCHHQVAQVIGVTGGDVDEVVVRAGHVIEGDRLRERQRVLAEAVDQVSIVDGEPHADERLNGAAEGSRIDVGVKATDHPAGAQAAHPLEARRWGDPHSFCKILVR